MQIITIAVYAITHSIHHDKFYYNVVKLIHIQQIIRLKKIVIKKLYRTDYSKNIAAISHKKFEGNLKHELNPCERPKGHIFFVNILKHQTDLTLNKSSLGVHELFYSYG